VFVLVLNKSASDSPHVLNEVEIAYKRIMKGGLSIIPFQVSEEVLSQAMEYYIKRLHWIDAVTVPLENSILVLMDRINELIKPGKEETQPLQEPIYAEKRYRNDYIREDDELEKGRLKIQENMLSNMDRHIYDELLNHRSNLSVLDIGSNDGNSLMKRIGNRNEVSKIIGIEINKEACERAIKQYASDRVRFFCCNCEDACFAGDLNSIMQKEGIEGFDIVTISMVLLHLKSPYQLLKNLRKVLKPGGALFILDIDDGINLAYPDPDGSFARVFKMCDYSEESGYRRSGRQVYTLLKRAGYKNISLRGQGINTIHMSYEERDALFNTYFSFIPEVVEHMMRKYPENNEIRADYQWLQENYNDLEEQFHTEDFFFQLGIMTYTAVK